MPISTPEFALALPPIGAVSPANRRIRTYNPFPPPPPPSVSPADRRIRTYNPFPPPPPPGTTNYPAPAVRFRNDTSAQGGSSFKPTQLSAAMQAASCPGQIICADGRCVDSITDCDLSFATSRAVYTPFRRGVVGKGRPLAVGGPPSDLHALGWGIVPRPPSRVRRRRKSILHTLLGRKKRR
jgi:hypothetical protein